jgi:hypothetical protein
MEFFVKKGSVVRQIWGKSDTVLFIFAGASAEFALNKAVDWLYFTGKLPADPLGRLFSTVEYARRIVFSENEKALRAIDQIAAIHTAVEAARGAKIPDWAYRDVLFMLIDYSIRSFEVLERKLSESEKEEVFDTFYRVGDRMGLVGLPESFKAWLVMRDEHLRDNTEKSRFTVDLYKQYRKHLGSVRYLLLKQAQVLVAPPRINQLLGLGTIEWLNPVISVYKLCRKLNLDNALKAAILPKEYQKQIKGLDIPG